MTTTASKRPRRPPQLPKGEPAYLWVPVALLAEHDSIVVLQQDVEILHITHREDEWLMRVRNPETRERSEVSYHAHNFVYTKASEAVKTRLAKQLAESKATES